LSDALRYGVAFEAGSRDLAEGEVVAVGAGERVGAGFDRLHAVEAHARGASPDDDIAVFEQDAPGRVGALQAAEEKDALESKRDRDDGLVEVELVAILVETEFGSGLVAVDMAGVGAELGEAGANGAAQGEVVKDPGDGRPELAAVWFERVPAPTEGLEGAAARDQNRHGQAAGRGGMMQGRCREDAFDGCEELGVLGQSEAAHEDSAGEELLVCRFGDKLGEEVHGLRA